MNKKDILVILNTAKKELQDLTKVVPKDYEEYNQIRLKYDTIMGRIQGCNLQIQAIELEERILDSNKE